ncbi:MAG: hypothetical protein O3C63_03045 [Cyanobacteria bacterium]|nr:hypothetical protein [Cyanobacteriota bacterium]
MDLYRIGLLFVCFLALPSFAMETRFENRLLEYDLGTVTDFVSLEPNKKQNIVKLRVKGLDPETIGSVQLQDYGLSNKYLRILTEGSKTVPDTGVVDFNLRVSSVRVNPQATTIYLRPFKLSDGLETETIALRIFVADDTTIVGCAAVLVNDCYQIDFDSLDEQTIFYTYTGSPCSIYSEYDKVDLSLCGLDANGAPLN